MVKLLKVKRRDVFEWDIILFWCHALWKLQRSNLCIFETKHASGLETCTKIYCERFEPRSHFFSIYLQPSVKKNSYNLAFWLCNLMTSRWKPSIGKKPFLTIKMSVFQSPNNGTFLVRLTHDFGKKKTSIFFSFFYFS